MDRGKSMRTFQPSRVLQDSLGHVDFVTNNRFRMSSENTQALEEIALLAEKHDLQIYLTHAPMFSGLYMNSELQRYLRELNESLANFANKYARIHIVDHTPETFNETEMENVDHLVFEAAERFTEIIADKILKIEQQDADLRGL